MLVEIQVFHNVEYETSFDEDETRWDINEAIDKFNDICIPDNVNEILKNYLDELNTGLLTMQVVSIVDCYLKMGTQSSIYRYMQNEPIFVMVFKIKADDNKVPNEEELSFVSNELVNLVFDNLNTNTVYVTESGTNIRPNFDLNGYYETSENFEDDEGEVSFYLDHRDNIEIKKLKEVDK